MRKVLMFVLAMLLAVPVVAYAIDYSITITEVSVLGCGPGSPVYFAGTTVYGNDPDQKCTRLFDKPEAQGYFNQPAIATWCDRRTSWNFTKQYNPGDYVLKAYVTSSGFFNQAFKTMDFHVPVCNACQ